MQVTFLHQINASVIALFYVLIRVFHARMRLTKQGHVQWPVFKGIPCVEYEKVKGGNVVTWVPETPPTAPSDLLD